MIKKIIYGLLGCLSWLISFLGVIVLFSGFNMIYSSPAGFIGYLIGSIILIYGSYWAGKIMFKSGEYNFIKKS